MEPTGRAPLQISPSAPIKFTGPNTGAVAPRGKSWLSRQAMVLQPPTQTSDDSGALLLIHHPKPPIAENISPPRGNQGPRVVVKLPHRILRAPPHRNLRFEISAFTLSIAQLGRSEIALHNVRGFLMTNIFLSPLTHDAHKPAPRALLRSTAASSTFESSYMEIRETAKKGIGEISRLQSVIADRLESVHFRPFIST